MTTSPQLPTYNDKLIEDLSEDEIASMDPQARVKIVTDAQRFVATGGQITERQSANLTRFLIYVRRRAVENNPRASAAARTAAAVIPATADDI